MSSSSSSMDPARSEDTWDRRAGMVRLREALCVVAVVRAGGGIGRDGGCCGVVGALGGAELGGDESCISTSATS
jgi:hypothetical protein